MKRPALLMATLVLVAPGTLPAAESTTLWHDRPATDWQKEALPIGNVRLGAMIFGGVGAGGEIRFTP